MRGFVIVLMALMLSSCATVQKLDAAGDVHALLISIRDGDRATFDTLVDRRALKQEMQSRLIAEARTSRVPGRRRRGAVAVVNPSLDSASAAIFRSFRRVAGASPPSAFSCSLYAMARISTSRRKPGGAGVRYSCRQRSRSCWRSRS